MIYISSTSVAGLTNRHPYQSVLPTTIRTLIGQKFNNIGPLLTTIYEEEKLYQKRWDLLTELHPDLLSLEFEPPYPSNLLYKEKYLLFFSQIPDESLKWINQKMTGFSPEKYRSEWDKVEPLYIQLQKIPEYQILTSSPTLNDKEVTIASITLESKITELTSGQSDLSSLLTRQVTMDRGTRLESMALQKFATQSGLQLAPDDKNRNTILTTSKGNRYKVGGRVDGIITSGTQPIGVVECKTRLGKVHTKETMPSYDLDQLTIYWYLTKLNIYYLVEFYEGEISIQEYSAAELQTRWEQIRPLLDMWIDNQIPILERSKKYFTLNPSCPTLELDGLSEKVRELITNI